MSNRRHRHTYTPSLRGLRMAATVGEQHRITEYEFDRGINALLAEAWEKGYDDGQSDGHTGFTENNINPYKGGVSSD